ncbi:MAG TPA: thermonuclease family protein [Afifellaceae bacterium]|nr:thermonuclease family protein [Afifellaceae bacterium]
MGILRFIFRTVIRSQRRLRYSRPPRRSVDFTPAQNGSQITCLPDIPDAGELCGRCYVIDGDTIVISRTKVRLAGIDAPELDQPWGQKAKWTMVEICKGQTITAKLTGERSYDRLIGTCYLPDGRDIGAELIKRGLALDGGIFSEGKYRHLEPHGARRKLKWIHFK